MYEITFPLTFYCDEEMSRWLRNQLDWMDVLHTR